jgi:YD repeat-containing protein
VAARFTTDAGGTTVTTPDHIGYQFDVNDQLTRVTLGDDGHELDVERMGERVSRVVGDSGRYLRYERTDGRLDAIVDHADTAVDLHYVGDRLTGVTGVDNQTEVYSYDGAGRLSQVTSPEGRVKLAAEYGLDGRVVSIEQLGVGVATLGYDDVNATRTITLADDTVVVQQHDWAGRLVTERVGDTGVHIVYDGEGRVVSRVTGVPGVPMAGFAPAAPATLYDVRGDPVTMADPTGRRVTTVYNDRHQPLVSTGSDGSTITRTYDGAGRLTTVID